jgi:hypothetical protein
MRNKMISGIAATAVVLAIFAAPANAVAGGSFGAAVEQVLLSQKDGRVGKLSADKKRELVSCVNTVLAKLPAGKKRYVTEAASLDEMQDRFGEVVLENRAEWKQKIARSCAKIALA